MALPRVISFRDLLTEAAEKVPHINEGVIDVAYAFLEGKDYINLGQLQELSAVDWRDRTCTPASASPHNLIEVAAPVKKKEAIHTFCIDEIAHFFDENTYNQYVQAFVGKIVAKISQDALYKAIVEGVQSIIPGSSTNITAGTAKSEIDQIIGLNSQFIDGGKKVVIYCDASKFYGFLDDLGTAGTSVQVLTNSSVSIPYRGAIVAKSPIALSGDYLLVHTIHTLVLPQNTQGAQVILHDARETAEGMYIRMLAYIDFAMFGLTSRYTPL